MGSLEKSALFGRNETSKARLPCKNSYGIALNPTCELRLFALRMEISRDFYRCRHGISILLSYITLFVKLNTVSALIRARVVLIYENL